MNLCPTRVRTRANYKTAGDKTHRDSLFFSSTTDKTSHVRIYTCIKKFISMFSMKIFAQQMHIMSAVVKTKLYSLSVMASVCLPAFTAPDSAVSPFSVWVTAWQPFNGFYKTYDWYKRKKRKRSQRNCAFSITLQRTFAAFTMLTYTKRGIGSLGTKPLCMLHSHHNLTHGWLSTDVHKQALQLLSFPLMGQLGDHHWLWLNVNEDYCTAEIRCVKYNITWCEFS